MQPKLYILCRSDLSDLTYSSLQGGHALAQYLIDYPDTEWNNGTLIYLDGGDEKNLMRWAEKLSYKGIKYSAFIEPDIGHQLTAIASLGDGKTFANLKLLGRKKNEEAEVVA